MKKIIFIVTLLIGLVGYSQLSGLGSKIVSQSTGGIPTPIGLISYYRFDGNSNDEVGVNNGTDTASVTYGVGVSGNSIICPAGNYTDLGTTQLIGGGRGAFTISYWGYNMGTARIFGSWTGTQSIIFDVQGSKPQIYVKLGGSQYGGQQVHNQTSFLNRWAHVCVTYDGAIIKVFVDSVEQAVTYAATGTTAVSPTQNEAWGRWAANIGAVEGLDSGAIWHRALSQSEIDNVYEIGLSGNELF